jgi:chaperonin cofactor prefoldin
MGQNDNVLGDIVQRPPWQRFLWKLILIFVLVLTTVVGLVFTAGTLYPVYKNLPPKVEELEKELKSLQNRPSGTTPSVSGSLEQRIAALEKSNEDHQTRLEKLESRLSSPDRVADNNNPNPPVRRIDRGIETFSIMLNEEQARKTKSGGFCLNYELNEHICDVNLKHTIVESGDWQPNAGDILKLSIPSKNLESWCMVVGLYTTKKDTAEAASVLVNVSQPVADELGFREPQDKRMVKVTVLRLADQDLTNDQRALRAKYGL